MKEILMKKNKNTAVVKEKFLEDMEILFSELKNSYGGYEYFGEERFELAKKRILERVNQQYTFETAIAILREELSAFIYDGHFSVDGITLMHPERKNDQVFDYALKQYVTDGIPVFDIKKFYYDNEEEQRQLEEFSESGEKYRNYPCLIFDLRRNRGGSDVYLWNFLTSLNGEEPEPPLDFVQKNSDTFLDYLKEECDITDVTLGIETEKSEGKVIQTGQKIYVLMDRYVCSSGESAIAYLKTVEDAVFVGENSGGCFFSGNCIDIYLPNSGLAVYYGTGRVLYHGKQNIDELGGFAPDICGEFTVKDVVAMYHAERKDKSKNLAHNSLAIS